jgi:RND family efflux transporter MFP subunit
MTTHQLEHEVTVNGEQGRSHERLPRHPELRARGSRIGRLVVAAVVVAAASWALYANFGAGQKALDMSVRVTSGGTPFPVTLAPVERGPITGTVTYTGTVAPLNEDDVFARVTGRVVDLPVYPGDAVHAGQRVARLDDVELTSKVREAEAMAAIASATRAQMEKELAMVDAELTYARGVARRSEQLIAVGAISRQEHENDRSMAASLEAKREAARAKLAAGDSMVAQNRAALRTANVVRDYVNVVAPTAGYVVKRFVAPGVLVQPGMAILKITQIDKVRLQANVGERDVASIGVGSRVAVSTAAMSEPMTAHVTSVAPFVDPGARTAVVEAIVDNADRRFLPGQYVTMRLITGERDDAVVVPRVSVIRLGGRSTVWVAKDAKAEAREVVVGLESADRVQIVRGLVPGERVVARGHEGLYAGAKLAETASAPAADAGLPAATPLETPKGGGHAGHTAR